MHDHPPVGTPEYEAWALEQRALCETRPVSHHPSRCTYPDLQQLCELSAGHSGPHRLKEDD